jgi:hypothetical protein
MAWPYSTRPRDRRLRRLDGYRRPPWASTIERPMESPIPIPSILVVKKGSNMRGRHALSAPVLLSSPSPRGARDPSSGGRHGAR